MTTYSFETHVYRGRTEREWPVDVEYRLDGRNVILTRWAISDAAYPLTGREIDDLQAQAEEHAAEVLAELEADLELAASRGGMMVAPMGSLAA